MYNLERFSRIGWICYHQVPTLSRAITMQQIREYIVGKPTRIIAEYCKLMVKDEDYL